MAATSTYPRRRRVERGNPTMPARQLAKELVRLRKATGLTQLEVGRDHVGCPDTTISKIETGERNVPEPHLRLMLRAYGVDLEGQHAASLMELAKQAREPGWWRSKQYTVPDWFDEYMGLETAATEVETYESELVPGLLQTSRYVEAISTAGPANNSEGITAVRAARQERLTSENPLTLRTILNEAVLWRPIGTADVMKEQLTHIIETARLPNVTVQVLPFAAGAHPGMTGPFTILRFPDGAEMDVVFIELRGDAEYPDHPEEVQEYTNVFDRLKSLALSSADTLTLLTETQRRYMNGVDQE